VLPCARRGRRRRALALSWQARSSCGPMAGDKGLRLLLLLIGRRPGPPWWPSSRPGRSQESPSARSPGSRAFAGPPPGRRARLPGMAATPPPAPESPRRTDRWLQVSTPLLYPPRRLRSGRRSGLLVHPGTQNGPRPCTCWTWTGASRAGQPTSPCCAAATAACPDAIRDAPLRRPAPHPPLAASATPAEAGKVGAPTWLRAAGAGTSDAPAA